MVSALLSLPHHHPAQAHLDFGSLASSGVCPSALAEGSHVSFFSLTLAFLASRHSWTTSGSSEVPSPSFCPEWSNMNTVCTKLCPPIQSEVVGCPPFPPPGWSPLIPGSRLPADGTVPQKGMGHQSHLNCHMLPREAPGWPCSPSHANFIYLNLPEPRHFNRGSRRAVVSFGNARH